MKKIKFNKGSITTDIKCWRWDMKKTNAETAEILNTNYTTATGLQWTANRVASFIKNDKTGLLKPYPKEQAPIVWPTIPQQTAPKVSTDNKFLREVIASNLTNETKLKIFDLASV